MNVTEQEAEQLNSMETFLSFIRTDIFHKFINCKQKIVAFFTGNQFGKNGSVAYSYVMRIYGIHPVAEKNVLYFQCKSRTCQNGHRHLRPPEDMICTKCSGQLGKFTGHKFGPYEVPAGMRHLTDGKPTEKMQCPKCSTEVTEHRRGKRIFRFASENLPNDKENTGDKGESAEIRNTVYPEFKKWCPPCDIEKDITARVPSMTIRDPFNRGKIIVEFVSYSQMSDRAGKGAGVQRMSIWCDEEPQYEFWDEQKPRLLAEDGDIVLTLTPATGTSWTFDEIYEKAAVYYRTKAVAEFTNKEEIEKTSSPIDIAVLQAATDDNPTLDKRVIERMFDSYDDPDVVATRRYGIHKQSTGRIFNFEYKVHFINRDRWFPPEICPSGMYHDWVHARLVDYHESTPWACSWIALSPENEAFVYAELNPSPEKVVTSDITHEMAIKSKDFKYRINMMDPLGTKTQSNTGTSVMDDFNSQFFKYKLEGTCTGGIWEAWDTKSTKGRDQIRERLRNSVEQKVPFNNKVVRDGREQYLPTLWVLDNCKLTAQSLKNWRKDKKGEPEQKFSHFCTALEAIFKDIRFRPRRGEYEREKSKRELGLFQGARR